MINIRFWDIVDLVNDATHTSVNVLQVSSRIPSGPVLY